MLGLGHRVEIAVLVVFLIGGLAFTSVEAHDLTTDDHCGTGSSPDNLFYAGGPPQYWMITSGGWNNCHLETYTTPNLINYAHWYLPTSSSYTHQYSLQPYVSSAGRTKTTEAIYYVYCCGHSGGVSKVIVMNQRANQGGFCYIIGSHFMQGPSGGFMQINDSNTKSDGVIYVDVFCWRA